MAKTDQSEGGTKRGRRDKTSNEDIGRTHVLVLTRLCAVTDPGRIGAQANVHASRMSSLRLRCGLRSPCGRRSAMEWKPADWFSLMPMQI